MIKELDTVALAHALPERGLEAGDLGTIVHVYEGGRGYELEFVTFQGETLAVVTSGRRGSADPPARNCSRAASGVRDGATARSCSTRVGSSNDLRVAIHAFLHSEVSLSS
jgi:hypothetical protein